MKKISIKKIAFIGVFTALSVALIYLIRFPIFPFLPFLEYDAGDIPIFLCTYLYGPFYGIIIAIVASVIQGITVSAGSGWVGIVMHIFAAAAYTLVAGLIYKRKQNITNLIFSAIAGIFVMTLMMGLLNLIFIPIFNGMPISEVINMMPFILLFNLIKSTANTVFAVLLYKFLNQKSLKNIMQ